MSVVRGDTQITTRERKGKTGHPSASQRSLCSASSAFPERDGASSFPASHSKWRFRNEWKRGRFETAEGIAFIIVALGIQRKERLWDRV